MCYMPAEILDSAHGVNVCYIGFFQKVDNLSILQAWAGLHFKMFSILTQRVLHNC
jgi:hypothetical protein